MGKQGKREYVQVLALLPNPRGRRCDPRACVAQRKVRRHAGVAFLYVVAGQLSKTRDPFEPRVPPQPPPVLLSYSLRATIVEPSRPHLAHWYLSTSKFGDRESGSIVLSFIGTTQCEHFGGLGSFPICARLELGLPRRGPAHWQKAEPPGRQGRCYSAPPMVV
jgi:hypothetical protein